MRSGFSRAPLPRALVLGLCVIVVLTIGCAFEFCGEG